MNRIEYEMSSWRTRVIHWLVDDGFPRFWAALAFEKSNFSGLELTRRMGAIWNIIYYDCNTENWAMTLYCTKLSLNFLMEDIVDIIEENDK